MRSVIGPAALALLLLAPAAHAADPGVEATVRKFAEAFNTGDVKTVKALHVAAPTIVDEVAPFRWTGPGAFDTWIADLTRSEKAEGKSGGVVAIGAPTREVVRGGRAYVIAPSTYTFKQKGATMRETAQITFAMTKMANGWKIAAWTWTGPEAAPIK